MSDSETSIVNPAEVTSPRPGGPLAEFSFFSPQIDPQSRTEFGVVNEADHRFYPFLDGETLVGVQEEGIRRPYIRRADGTTIPFDQWLGGIAQGATQEGHQTFEWTYDSKRKTIIGPNGNIRTLESLTWEELFKIANELYDVKNPSSFPQDLQMKLTRQFIELNRQRKAGR